MPRLEPFLSPAALETRAGILLVEDEVLLRSIVADYLRLQQFRVIEAGSVAEAQRALASFGDAIHFVMTDIHMPGELNGIDLVEFIQAHYPHLPVLVVSGTLSGANGWPFLRKPFQLDRLLSVVQTLLRSPEPS